MYVAKWKNKVIAKSAHTIKIEGNHYFPPQDVNMDYLTDSDYQTRCPWKGMASYYNVVIDGDINENAAWYYPEPSEKAKAIENYVGFWQGVEVVRE